MVSFAAASAAFTASLGSVPRMAARNTASAEWASSRTAAATTATGAGGGAVAGMTAPGG